MFLPHKIPPPPKYVNKKIISWFFVHLHKFLIESVFSSTEKKSFEKKILSKKNYFTLLLIILNFPPFHRIFGKIRILHNKIVAAFCVVSPFFLPNKESVFANITAMPV